MSNMWKLTTAVALAMIVIALALPSVFAPIFANDAQEGVPARPTFAKDILPIFQKSCQDCHRPGTAAPMSLLTYETARPWAKSIRERVLTRNMPPWHIARTVGIQRFQNNLSLTDEQINTIVR